MPRRVSTLRICCFAVVLGIAARGVAADGEPSPGPDPIVIKRTGGPPSIPDVARDEVICFALYTVHNRTLKLSAQLYPLQEGEPHRVSLYVDWDGDWRFVADAAVDSQGWLATFRVAGWDATRNWPYRITHPGGAVYEGTIRRDPIDQDEIRVAAFTGNSNSDRTPREDIVKNVKAHDPDLLFFSGDQSYDHKQHTAAWLLFGRQFGEIIKDRPTVTIPDDHDVGQANLWGEGGTVAHLRGAADGGFRMPADYVNLVQRAQTSHLPDPYDPTPIAQDITVYYTSLNVGGVDFAILEDRKWKTGPAGLLQHDGPRPDHINDPDFDVTSADVPEARLLGSRQLEFLRAWGMNWSGAQMKAVLSQTIFAGGAHFHGRHNARLIADLDSNGWPQSGRARALQELRRCFAIHIAGDQHLATVIHHGINTWEDAGFSFCVPSIVNFYGRWWWPEEEALPHATKGRLPYTGRYYDGFRNKLTMYAYANPTKENHNAAGYGLIRFHKPTRQITLECWPRHVDVTAADAPQHPGWPITISQLQNYARKPLAHLPTLEISGQADPVVQVIEESTGETVYTLRIRGSRWRPPVFWMSRYTIRVGEGEGTVVKKGIEPAAADSDAVIEISLNNS